METISPPPINYKKGIQQIGTFFDNTPIYRYIFNKLKNEISDSDIIATDKAITFDQILNGIVENIEECIPIDANVFIINGYDNSTAMIDNCQNDPIIGGRLEFKSINPTWTGIFGYLDFAINDSNILQSI